MSYIEQELIEYKTYLLLEKNLSANTIEAYMRDIYSFVEFFKGDILNVEMDDIENFIAHLYDQEKSTTSQARIVSGVKSFFNYLYIYDKIENLPTELIESPKILRKIPDYLVKEEVDRIVEAIDMSKPMAHRNRAIIVVLYCCGLRVSELVGMRINDLFLEDNYIRVVGKGDKQRLVPINSDGIKAIELYREERRAINVPAKSADFLFLGRRGTQLSRVMVFNIVKEVVRTAGIDKRVSPHTFRHSFASHLIRGGADIRAVQQMLGHESIITTEIYTHIDTSKKRESVEKLFPTDKLSL